MGLLNKLYQVIRGVVLKSRNFRTLLGFSISAVLLWLTFYDSGLSIRNLGLKGEQWFYFSVAILSFVLATWLQSVRAKLIWLNKGIKQNEIYTYSSLLVGNFYNCLLPGNLGEGIRAWHFSRKNKVPFQKSLAAIVAEKWIDAQFFVLLTLVLFILKPFVNHYVLLTISCTTAVILVLSFIYGLMLYSKRIKKIIWLPVISLKSPGRFLFRMYTYTSQQITGIKTNGWVSHYVLLCMAVLFLNISQFFLLLKAVGIAQPVGGLYSAYIVAVSMMVIVFIPSAPGNIGVLHYGIYSVLILAASQYGVVPTIADLQSYALLGVYVHLSYFIPEVIMGGIFVLLERRLLFGLNR